MSESVEHIEETLCSIEGPAEVRQLPGNSPLDTDLIPRGHRTKNYQCSDIINPYQLIDDIIHYQQGKNDEKTNISSRV